MHLAAEDVEEVSGGGHVDDLHVAVLVLALEAVLRGKDPGILIRELEVALEATGGVLGTLAVVAVGKGHDEAGTLHPLDLAGGDELVDDALGVVGEVAELGLPHDEGVGGGEGVAVLEAKGAELAEGRVGDDELGLVAADVLERGVGVFVLLVVEDGVALGEGAALDVLAGNANVVALGDKGAEGEGLSGGPVDVLALLDSLATVSQDTGEVAMRVEAVGERRDDLSNVLEGLLVGASGARGQRLLRKFLG